MLLLYGEGMSVFISPHSLQHCANKIVFWILTTTVFILDLVASDFDVCHFEHYNASCTILLSGVWTRSTATINHCHDPVDVTFSIKAMNPHINWSHTFVTTNPPENQEVNGFTETVLLHVELHINHHEVTVKAAFHVNNFQDVPFLNSQVRIATFEDCIRAASHSSTGKQVVLGIALVGVLLGWCAAVIGWVCRRKRQTAERLALVDDMEVDTLSSSCPSSSVSSSTVRGSELKEEESFLSSTSAAG